MKVGEVAAAPSGDENFLSQTIGVLEHGDATTALAGFHGTHQSRRAAAENECIEGIGHHM